MFEILPSRNGRDAFHADPLVTKLIELLIAYPDLRQSAFHLLSLKPASVRVRRRPVLSTGDRWRVRKTVRFLEGSPEGRQCLLAIAELYFDSQDWTGFETGARQLRKRGLLANLRGAVGEHFWFRHFVESFELDAGIECFVASKNVSCGSWDAAGHNHSKGRVVEVKSNIPIWPKDLADAPEDWQDFRDQFSRLLTRASRLEESDADDCKWLLAVYTETAHARHLLGGMGFASESLRVVGRDAFADEIA